MGKSPRLHGVGTTKIIIEIAHKMNESILSNKCKKAIKNRSPGYRASVAAFYPWRMVFIM